MMRMIPVVLMFTDVPNLLPKYIVNNMDYIFLCYTPDKCEQNKLWKLYCNKYCENFTEFTTIFDECANSGDSLVIKNHYTTYENCIFLYKPDPIDNPFRMFHKEL